ncbi:succinyl-diaminopimelate desuccinylase [Gordonia araii NBRC 100433]|uniref:Succinyl-diaminopimelate desuccinylase n=1 Tax=Gordonia araii NBRC 100433 TaxID=1073574 RepID=G7H446_9ACTN|nr:succinyl-diaminopimelate desuccinylase [Gordonia araii]GAB10621.1 succinyl-diaminopimelate desuccinylase [Gordonia araii NBRC 100433]
MALDLRADPALLTAALIDIASPSREEEAIADAVAAALHAQTDGFEIVRDGNRVLARTSLGRERRVLLAGHLDTVPIADNVPHRWEKRTDSAAGDPGAGDIIHGCGSVDMKSGDAVFLHLAATLENPRHDLTLVFYDCEEIAAKYNGLGVIERERPEWLDADVAILGEPTGGLIEAGCQGTLRVRVSTSGVRAHTARAWMGDNAIHRLSGLLGVLADYEPRRVDIDGCEYREGLQAVAVNGGVAGNVVPDEASVDINFRFAPDRTPDQALAHVREVIASAPGGADLAVELTDSAAGALPGLSNPAAAELVAAADNRFRAKYGWTDVSRFAARGIPAVNFGPGDPSIAHRRDEHVAVAEIHAVHRVLRDYLTGDRS